MKTTIELQGFEIVIEEVDGTITVSASKDEEVVEEFTLETEGQDSGDDSEVQGFDEFGDEEKDFDDDDESADDDDSDDDDSESDDDDDDSDEDLGDETKLESFQSFITKRK